MEEAKEVEAAERIQLEQEAKEAEDNRVRLEQEAKEAEDKRVRLEQKAKEAENNIIQNQIQLGLALSISNEEQERVRLEQEAKEAEEKRIRLEQEAKVAEDNRVRLEQKAKEAEAKEIYIKKQQEKKTKQDLINLALALSISNENSKKEKQQEANVNLEELNQGQQDDKETEDKKENDITTPLALSVAYNNDDGSESGSVDGSESGSGNVVDETVKGDESENESGNVDDETESVVDEKENSDPPKGINKNNVNKLLAAITTLLVKGHTQHKIINGKPFDTTLPTKPVKKPPTKPPKPERKQKSDDSGDSGVYSSDDDSGVYSSDKDNLFERPIIVNTKKELEGEKTVDEHLHAKCKEQFDEQYKNEETNTSKTEYAYVSHDDKYCYGIVTNYKRENKETPFIETFIDNVQCPITPEYKKGTDKSTYNIEQCKSE